MTEINETDWNFDRICASRAARLESAGTPEDLIKKLEASLKDACASETLHIAIDSSDNAFVDRRVIVQFKVDPILYDWFFNARTGYRAQFWITPTKGTEFNQQIIASLRAVLEHRLPESVSVRRIKVLYHGGSREECDVGADHIARDEVLRSLVPAASKIWIGERLYQDGQVKRLETLLAQSPGKLNVPRWTSPAPHSEMGATGEGLLAPFLSAEYSWLDLKGGFLDPDGQSAQIKPQDTRARAIHERGWT